ncbi:hypothetical protein WMY93_031060 [Mugilogobius chulae]|uniref:Tight junction-associated protein 1 domain-containing protein n=1 Tax=Mugilogobius chulae TaxID=88201 RepID=A0AAW0MPD3_9GOBI
MVRRRGDEELGGMVRREETRRHGEERGDEELGGMVRREETRRHGEERGEEKRDKERKIEEVVGLILSFVFQEAVSESERIRLLEAQNEELRRRLSLSNQRTEALGAELDSCRHYMEAELNRTRDDLDKMRDKFRRLQNSYTASQRANQDLEEKLHALLRKVERDKKTMDQELVELTNKLLDERYRQDCNLAVQLLKCNKSHFRNHKFADLLSLVPRRRVRVQTQPLPGPAPPLQAPPPHALYPGRKVIEFSSDVKVPKNSPLPNCTYATRQAISLSLVESPAPSPAPSHAQAPESPAPSHAPANQREALSEPLSSQSSPFSSPPQALSGAPSSGSSEEDLLNSWQRLFVDKMAPSDSLHRTAFSSQSARELQRRGGAYSDGEEVSSNQSWTPSRGSSLDTDTDPETRPRPEPDLLRPSPVLLLDVDEERDVLPVDLPLICPQPIGTQQPGPAPQQHGHAPSSTATPPSAPPRAPNEWESTT